MPIDFQEIRAGLRQIKLSGRLDIPGTDEIANRFAALAASDVQHIVLDLSGVSFLGSIGIRQIVINAKAAQHRGGRLVMYVGDNAAVNETIAATGIATMIPVFTDLAAAEQAAVA
jgi:anti-anti-sigma factor